MSRVRITALLALLALLALPAVARAATRYTAPGGTATIGCSQASPCDLVSAIQGAQDGDTVLVQPGQYGEQNIGLGSILAERALTIRGTGSSPSAVDAVLTKLEIRNPATTLSNMTLDVHSVYGLAFAGAVADHLVVRSTGEALRTCGIFLGELRDSVCISHGGVAAVFGQSYTEIPSALNATLRNVTAIGTGGAKGLVLGATTGQDANMTLTNSIVRGDGGDVFVYDDGSGGHTHVTADHSSYATVLGANGIDTVTAAGSGSNQTAAPAFANAAADDYHEASGSPTIDAGTATGVPTGDTDLDGHARVQGAAPDIGAYEFGSSAPPPPQPPPAGNPVASFTFSPGSPAPGDSIAFDGSASTASTGSASITSYSWNFGDGTSASGAVVNHAYADPGNYTVTLTVSDSLGRSATVGHSVRAFPAGGQQLPELTFGSQRVIVSGSTVRVGIGCGLAQCSGSVALRVTHTVRVRRSGRLVRVRRTDTVASGTFTIVGSPTGPVNGAPVTLKLTRTGRALLKAAGPGGLRTAAAARTADVRQTAIVRLLPAAP